MNEAILRAFLDDCKDAPLDGVPRLILADWLQDQATTPTEYARADHLRRATLARDGFAPLSGEPDHAWLEPLRVRPNVRVTSFQGLGAVRARLAFLLSAEIHAIARMPAWDWVETLAIQGPHPQLDAILDGPIGERIGRLRCGDFSYGRFTPGTARLARVRSLTCGTVRLETDSFRQFGLMDVLPRLHELEIEAKSDQIRSLGHWPLIEVRRLQVLCAAPQGLQQLLQGPHLTHLRELDLDLSVIDPWAFRALNDAPLSRTLERFHAAGVSLGNAGATCLAGADLPCLRRLHLAHAKLGAKGVRALSRAAWLAGLEALDLSHNPMANGALAELFREPLPVLRHLNVTGNHPGPDFWHGLLACPRLESLHLEKTRPGEAGLLALADWPGLAGVTELRLHWDDVTETGLRALLDSLYRHEGLRIEFTGNAPANLARLEVVP